LAVAGGNPHAQQALDHFAQEMSREQIAEGEQSALQWRDAHTPAAAR
jgi:hypothetical protein